MLTKAAYVVWVSSALKLRKGKESLPSSSLPLPTLFPIWPFYINPAHFLFHLLSPSNSPLQSPPSSECFYSNKAVIPSFRWHHLVYWVGVAQRSSAAAAEAKWSTAGWFWYRRLRAPGRRPPSWFVCRLRQFPEKMEVQQLIQVSLVYANSKKTKNTPG